MIKFLLLNIPKMNFLNTTIIIFILICSCSTKGSTKYYYIRCYQESGVLIIDTVDAALDRYQTKQASDSLCYTQAIVLNGINHELRKYSNADKAPMDGDYTFYELDNLGIIYSTQLSWQSYKRICTNNDSINQLIDVALLNCIAINEHEIGRYIQATKNKVVKFSDKPAI